jgi:hypothetical protein
MTSMLLEPTTPCVHSGQSASSAVTSHGFHRKTHIHHAAGTAYLWPADLLAHELTAAGFDVIETHPRAGVMRSLDRTV